MTKATWTNERKWFGLVATLLLAAAIFHQVSRADEGVASMNVLYLRGNSCLSCETELDNVVTTKLVQDATSDFGTVNEVHSALEKAGNSAHFLQTLCYLYLRAPKSFRPTVRETLTQEIKYTKKENAENILHTNNLMKNMTDVPAALAVNHAKQCLENYQNELNALKP